MGIATTVESQSLNMIVMGFTFASAIAWYHVVAKLVEKFVKSGTGLKGDVIAALATTLFAVVVFMVLKMFVRNVEIKDPSQVTYAVVGR